MARKKTFETALHQLEKTVELLESGELSLEDSLKSFEEGVKAAATCREALAAVETRVELLMRGDDASLEVREFEDGGRSSGD